MWTPKRLLLLLVGFVLFFGCYQVYVLFLGKYDGLPPLPEEYRPVAPSDVAPVVDAPRQNHAVTRLIEAFGPNCEEQYRRIKLEWRLQGVVVAADRWQILDNGHLRLDKVSVAMFGKPKPNQKFPEINTVRGEQADIEFDKPLTDRKDVFDRKPIAGKLVGKGMKVEVRSNRQTPQLDDDVRLYTDWLAYSDKEHRIWTNAEVRLVDSEPEQARVTAIGMEVFLIPSEDKAPEKSKNKKSKEKDKPKLAEASPEKKGSISGVKSVRLGKEVCMNLLIDAKSAFLGSSSSKTAPQESKEKATGPGSESPPGAPSASGSLSVPNPKKTPVVVTSHGPFFYDVENDRADFAEKVTVIRKQDVPGVAIDEPTTRYDQLDCDKLVLFFVRKKKDEKVKPGDDQAGDLDLVKADATGQQIELTSDSEKLHAIGKELVYDKANNQTILRGDPVDAERDGNFLHVSGTLVFQNPTEGQKDIQNARADGPGEIRIRNTGEEKPEPNVTPLEASKPIVERVARWSKEMRITKEGQLDRLDFVGDASFEDPDQGKLKADQIVVWLEDRPKAAGAPPMPMADPAVKPSPGGNRVPRRLEAVGRVSLDSRDLKVPQTDYLRLQFDDAKPGELTSAQGSGGRKPPIAEEKGTNAPGSPESPPKSGNLTAPVAGTGPKPAAPTPAPARADVLPPEKDEIKEPLVLLAKTVDVKLLIEGKKTDLREVRAEGQVHVTRRPIPGKDDGVEIKGERLDLFHNAEGNVLKVTGQPGYVQLDRLKLLGPTVNIDQPANNAWVNGGGSMRLPSKTDFQGNPLKEPVDVTVYWTDSMFFDGKIAEFDGNVQADQGDTSLGGARLACQKLEVVLDRTVSMKDPQGKPSEQPAALYRMLCDRNCRLEKGVREGAKWKQFQRIEGREVLFDNPSSQLNVYGPGVVHMLHEGSSGDLAGTAPLPAPKTTAPKKDAKEAEMKLTRINFQGHMQANKASGVVIFTDHIDLIHVPASDPDAPIDPLKLPIGGMWLGCNKLRAVSRRIDANTVQQEFEATDRVRIQGRMASGEYSGQADIVKYDESKDLLILESTGTNLATLSRQIAPGRPKEPVRAKRIWYWRTENRVRLDDTDVIQVTPGAPAGKRP